MDDTDRPLSVKEISDQALDFKFNPLLPIKSWLRTAQMLHREAEIYLHDGNFAKAYMIYMRYSTLVMDHLGKHPGIKRDKESRQAWARESKNLPNVLANLEKIKPIIAREYEDWEAAEARRKERREKLKGDQAARSQTPYERHASKDPSLSAARRLLDAGEHQELAVDLAQREMRRRDAGRKATRQAGVSDEEEQRRRTAGFWDNWTAELAEKQAEDDEMFRKQMEMTRHKLDGGEDQHIKDFIHKMSREERDREEASSRPARHGSSLSYHYPSILKSQPVEYEQPAAFQPDEPAAARPPRPPKEYFVSGPFPTDAPPERPSKELLQPAPSHQPPQARQPALPPKVAEMPASPPPASKRLTFKPAAYLENGEPIRSIFLPSRLREAFLRIASDHTRRGVEMCGILCGTAVNNALFIKCLVIPEQKCTSDTCETENESALFDYCMTEDLLMLGWIHTHPTQSCFMSSRDLHTQAGYQVMLPESIAIVCAPRFQPSFGIFRLTNPPGLPHILHCNETATFHQHSIDNLYTGAQQPAGHVFESEKLEFDIKDLRPGGK